MKINLKQLGIVLSVFGIAACDSDQQSVPLYEVTTKAFEIEVPAKGELEAAEAELIASPGRRPMVLSWLAQEYSNVKQGELIATFDGEQLSLEAQQEALAMQLIEQDIIRQNAAQKGDQNSLSSEQGLVEKEFEFSDKFNIEDVRIYSQLEIIDFSQNKEFLTAKDNFLDWKEDSVVKQNESAIGVLNIKKQGHQAKYQQKQDALNKLEIRAPYSGLLVYEKNYRGEKPAIGQTMFPGATIAKLPNLEKMQAKLYVLDKEAIGLSEGQNVEFKLDAQPDVKLTGTVKSVAAFSRTIQRGNPAKYFEIVATFDQSDKRLLQPGKKVSAIISVSKPEPSLIVPMQAIHNRDGKTYVIKQKGEQFVYQQVELAEKNLYFVKVKSGLSEGEKLALSMPEQEVLNG
jgi:multidrug efflux pump subunit AcrA (membrane-fusion protein)